VTITSAVSAYRPEEPAHKRSLARQMLEEVGHSLIFAPSLTMDTKTLLP